MTHCTMSGCSTTELHRAPNNNDDVDDDGADDNNNKIFYSVFGWPMFLILDSSHSARF